MLIRSMVELLQTALSVSPMVLFKGGRQVGRECKQIYLIYPETENTEKIDTSYCFKGVGLDKDVTLNIVFFDLQKSEFKDGNGLLEG